MVWLTIPLIVIASIWLPVVVHYQAPDVQITPLTIEVARRKPPDAVLEVLRGDRLLGHGWGATQQLITAAEDLLRGELRLRGHAPTEFQLPFREANLTPPSSWLQLMVAGLVPADLLLQAYELTGRDEFFVAARGLILGFALYERGAWLPRGLLWNDHAIANRVFVLSDFWRMYRHRGDFRLEEARTVLEFVARNGALLAKPQHFTFATNHGTMQNLALLRLRLCFPSLPNAEYFQRLAMERFGEQMAFYVNGEGVVLEHSALYQFFGIRLLKLLFRYIHELGLSVPKDWELKYARALRFADQLRRPDGSSPLLGDTSWQSRFLEPLPGPPDPSIAWYPVAGYAIWWDGLERWPQSRYLRQTVVAFSYYSGHAHKLADELSVLLWAGGQTWWTNLGYWPDDRRERSLAESWNGSNAPHLLHEPKESPRTPRLLSYGESQKTLILDAVREGPGTYLARRQLIHLRPDAWIILDVISGAPGRQSITRWTVGHGVIVRAQESGRRYLLEKQNAPGRLFSFFFGSPGLSLRTLPRSLGPFLDRSSSGIPESKVPAIEVGQPADGSWAATVWVFDEDGTLVLPRDVQPKMTMWQNSQNWTVAMSAKSIAYEVERKGDRLIVREQGRTADIVRLRPPAPTPQREEIRRAFLNAANKYPQFRARIRYRQWSTYGLVLVVGAQEFFLRAVVGKRRRIYGRLRLLTVSLWILGGILLSMILHFA